MVESTTISNDVRRILILISKVLQNIANNITPTSSKQNIDEIDQFVNNSIGRMNNFFLQIIV